MNKQVNNNSNVESQNDVTRSVKDVQAIKAQNVISDETNKAISQAIFTKVNKPMPDTISCLDDTASYSNAAAAESSANVDVPHVSVAYSPQNIINFEMLTERQQLKVAKSLKEMKGLGILVENGNKIAIVVDDTVSILDANDGRVICYVDAFRYYVASLELFGLPKVKRRVRRYIAVAFNDTLGVIVDTELLRVVGFVNAEDVEMLNAFGITMQNSDATAFRFLSWFNIEGVYVSLPMSHLIVCRHYGYFGVDTLEVHHVKNSADNRREFLQTKELHTSHPAEEHLSVVHISRVIESLGYTVENFTSICVEKALAIKNSK